MTAAGWLAPSLSARRGICGVHADRSLLSLLLRALRYELRATSTLRAPSRPALLFPHPQLALARAAPRCSPRVILLAPTCPAVHGLQGPGQPGVGGVTRCGARHARHTRDKGALLKIGGCSVSPNAPYLLP